MSKALASFKKKPFANPALHEGLILLIHEHFKALTLSKSPTARAKAAASGSSSFSSNSKEIQSISLGDDYSEPETEKGKAKRTFPILAYKRKSPRGLGKNMSGKIEAESEEDEKDMETEEDDKGDSAEDAGGRKRKRGNNAGDKKAITQEQKKVKTSPAQLNPVGRDGEKRSNSNQETGGNSSHAKADLQVK
jgi:hypothetical protein